MKLYYFPLSGHSHRAQLFLSLVGVPHELVEVDLAAGAHKQPDFLAMNAFGEVPVLDDGGTVIADSNAILVYVARKVGPSPWLPTSGRWKPAAGSRTPPRPASPTSRSTATSTARQRGMSTCPTIRVSARGSAKSRLYPASCRSGAPRPVSKPNSTSTSIRSFHSELYHADAPKGNDDAKLPVCPAGP